MILRIEYGEAEYEMRDSASTTTRKNSHGRRRRLEYYFLEAPDQEQFRRWPGVGSVGMIYRREEGDKICS